MLLPRNGKGQFGLINEHNLRVLFGQEEMSEQRDNLLLARRQNAKVQLRSIALKNVRREVRIVVVKILLLKIPIARIEEMADVRLAAG